MGNSFQFLFSKLELEADLSCKSYTCTQLNAYNSAWEACTDFLKVAHCPLLLMKCRTLYQCKIKLYPLTSQCIRIKSYPLTIEEGKCYLPCHCQVLRCHYEKANLAKVTLALSGWLYSWSYGKLPCLTVFDLQLWQFHMVQHNRSRPPFFFFFSFLT